MRKRSLESLFTCKSVAFFHRLVAGVTLDIWISLHKLQQHKKKVNQFHTANAKKNTSLPQTVRRYIIQLNRFENVNFCSISWCLACPKQYVSPTYTPIDTYKLSDIELFSLVWQKKNCAEGKISMINFSNIRKKRWILWRIRNFFCVPNINGYTRSDFLPP